MAGERLSGVVRRVGMDFDLIRVKADLGAQAERLALEAQIDEFDGLNSLLSRLAVGQLVGVELKIELVNSDDGSHLGLAWRSNTPRTLLRIWM